jgi:hypothetical protein
MKTHRNPRPRLSKQRTPDNEPATARHDRDEIDELISLMRDNLGKADAFITAAEREIQEAWSSGEDEPAAAEDATRDSVLRRRSRIEHLVEAGKLAVRAAAHTTEEIDNRRRRDA